MINKVSYTFTLYATSTDYVRAFTEVESSVSSRSKICFHGGRGNNGGVRGYIIGRGSLLAEIESIVVGRGRGGLYKLKQ